MAPTADSSSERVERGGVAAVELVPGQPGQREDEHSPGRPRRGARDGRQARRRGPARAGPTRARAPQQRRRRPATRHGRVPRARPVQMGHGAEQPQAAGVARPCRPPPITPTRDSVAILPSGSQASMASPCHAPGRDGQPDRDELGRGATRARPRGGAARPGRSPRARTPRCGRRRSAPACRRRRWLAAAASIPAAPSTADDDRRHRRRRGCCRARRRPGSGGGTRRRPARRWPGRRARHPRSSGPPPSAASPNARTAMTGADSAVSSAADRHRRHDHRVGGPPHRCRAGSRVSLALHLGGQPGQHRGVDRLGDDPVRREEHDHRELVGHDPARHPAAGDQGRRQQQDPVPACWSAAQPDSPSTRPHVGVVPGRGARRAEAGTRCAAARWRGPRRRRRRPGSRPAPARAARRDRDRVRGRGRPSRRNSSIATTSTIVLPIGATAVEREPPSACSTAVVDRTRGRRAAPAG